MGYQLLEVSGLVLFILILLAHFGSKLADRRDRLRLALALAGLAVLVAATIVAWSVVTLALARRALGLFWDIRDLAKRNRSGPDRGRGY